MKDLEMKFLGNDENGQMHSLGQAEGKKAWACLAILLVLVVGGALIAGPIVSKAVLEISKIIL